MTAQLQQHATPGAGPQMGPAMLQPSSAEIVPFTAKTRQAVTSEQTHSADLDPAPAASQRQIALTASELWRATKEDRIVPHYQPQFELTSGRTVAAEALARIVDEHGSMIPPNLFIDEADQSGVIVPLGRAVIRQACEDLTSLRDQGLPLQRIAINLSGLQLTMDSSLVHFVSRTLDQHDLAAADFDFEVTMDQLLELDRFALEILSELRHLGARVVIDDFGIDHEAIARLAEFEIDAVKLDRSIVQRLPYDRKATCLTRTLVCLAQAMGIDVIAVGLETQEQVNALAETGCRYGQGFVHSKPGPKVQLVDFLQS
jgi:EAL domain-containing protein (putative c-di-GMP-specific phosphodiesterase class I)